MYVAKELPQLSPEYFLTFFLEYFAVKKNKIHRTLVNSIPTQVRIIIEIINIEISFQNC